VSVRLRRITRLTGKIKTLTGLHIGASQDTIEIGGADNPVIKHPITQEPYIPGSSLKGKMRSQMEKIDGINSRDKEEPCGCGRCMVCRIFGPHKNARPPLGPSRIIVRDASLSEQSREAIGDGEWPYEVKTENLVKRKSGVAQHPRPYERVPSGVSFDLEIVVQFLSVNNKNDDEKAIVEYILRALKAVEDSYLGGGGSRGSGKVKFCKLELDGQPVQLPASAIV